MAAIGWPLRQNPLAGPDVSSLEREGMLWAGVSVRLGPPAASGEVPFHKMEFRSRRQNTMGVDTSRTPKSYRYSDDGLTK